MSSRIAIAFFLITSQVCAQQRMTGSPNCPAGGPWITQMRKTDFPIEVWNEELTRFPLGSPFDSVAVGGEGRYFVLHFPGSEQTKTEKSIPEKLAVWDLLTLSIAFEIPLPTRKPASEPKFDPVKGLDRTMELLYTAGLEDLIFFSKSANEFERWSLTSGKRLNLFKNPYDKPIDALAMGSGSIGPLVVVLANDTGEYAEQTFEFADPHAIVWDRSQSMPSFHQRRGYLLRASTNGRALTFCNPTLSGLECILLKKKPARVSSAMFMGHFVPNADGDLLYSTNGAISLRGPYPTPQQIPSAIRREQPAISGPYCFEIKPKTNRNPPPPVTEDTPVLIELRLANEPKSLRTIDRLRTRDVSVAYPVADFTLVDHRISWIPWADVIVQIPKEQDAMILHRVDLDRALREFPLDYLFVTSRPATVISSKVPFLYQVETKSSVGVPRFKLDLSPQGATITDEGLLSWKQPASSSGTASFTIRITGQKNKSIYHSFECNVE